MKDLLENKEIPKSDVNIKDNTNYSNKNDATLINDTFSTINTSENSKINNGDQLTMQQTSQLNQSSV